jgi:hypothetical protein
MISLLQCIKQAQWPEENPVLALPGMTRKDGTKHEYGSKSIAQLLSIPKNQLDNQLPREVSTSLSCSANGKFLKIWETIPRLKAQASQQSAASIRVHVRRLNRAYTDRSLIYAPNFTKPQQESWFVLVTDASEDKIFGLERLTLSGRGGGEGAVNIEIPGDYKAGSLVVRVLSDGWRGVDFKTRVPWKSAEIFEMDVATEANA